MKKLLLPLMCLASGISYSSGTILLTNDFSTYSSGNLVGQSGWTQIGATSNLPLLVDAGKVSMQQGTAQDASNAFTSTNSGSIYYFSQINFSAKGATADYPLSLYQGGSYGARLYAKSLNTGYQLAWGGGTTAPTTFGVQLSLNTTYNIVMRYDIVAGAANDTGKLYVSQNSFNSDESLNTPYQDVTTWTGGTELTSFSDAVIRQGSNSGTLTVGQFNVATTFSEVIPVPEPSTWALIGLGSALVLWRVKSRRNDI
jgi:hypothetical protein